MDCSVCTSMPAQLRPPRNTICGACYEGARSLISFVNKLEAAQGIDKANLCKNLMNVSTWVLDMKDSSEELDGKIKFVSGFVVAFRDQIHTDIQLRSGENRPPIPAHRALLAIRSEIFSNMLDSDGCKAPPSDDTITLPELNHEELECFLELLYSGDLAEERMSKHVYSLSLAADKYGVSFLQKLCERHMLKSLSSSNALDVLEVADTCSFLLLKENALNYIVKNMQEIVFSAEYDTFALKNPHLSVQITRASLMDARRNCVEIPELREKNRFLRFSSTFRDQIDNDILVRSGDKGPSRPAHKAILASGEPGTQNIVIHCREAEQKVSTTDSSDVCKPLRQKNMDFVVLPELKHDELESFIVFLYTAELPEEKMNKHVYALSLADDKYRIPYLLKFCERHLIKNQSLSNVLDVLEVANVCSYLASVKKGALC